MAIRRYGPVNGAGTVLEEREGTREVVLGARGLVAYTGVTERGPVGQIAFCPDLKTFQRKYGGRLPDAELPNAAFDYFDHSRGAGGMWILRMTDGSEVAAGLTLYTRHAAGVPAVGVAPKSAGAWGGKRLVFRGQYAAGGGLTATTLTTGLTRWAKNQLKGGVLSFVDAPGLTYVITGNTAAGVISVAGDSSMLLDSGAQTYKVFLVEVANADAWGRDRALAVQIKDGAEFPSTEWGLDVYVNGELVKSWPNLSSDPTSTRYFLTVVNGDLSNDFVTLSDQYTGDKTVAAVRPANRAGTIPTAGVSATTLTLPAPAYAVVSAISGNPTVGSFSYGSDVRSQVITLTFTDATHFTVTSSIFGSAALPTGVLGSAYAGTNGPGYVESAVGPFDLSNLTSLTTFLQVQFNAGGAQSFTLVAVRAKKTGAAASYAAPTGKTLTFKINGGPEYTYTAAASASDAAGTAADFNSKVLGARMIVNGTETDIESDVAGTSSSVEITGGNGTAVFGHSVGVNGNTVAVAASNVVNLFAVTAAEVVAKLSTLTNGSASVVGGKVRLTSTTLGGTGTATVNAASTADGAMGGQFATNAVGTGAAGAVHPQFAGFTATAGASPIQAGDTIVITVRVLPADELVGGYAYPDTTNGPRTKFRIVSNTARVVTVAPGSDLTVIGADGDTFRLEWPQELEGGYDGTADLDAADYEEAFSLSTSPWKNLAGKGAGLVKFACPGVTTTAVQQAGKDYAEANNYQYRYEIPAATVDEVAAENYVSSTLGRSNYAVAAFPSYAQTANPRPGAEDLVTRPITGKIHGLEARYARDFEGYQQPAAGTEAKLLGIVDLPAGLESPATINEEVLTPRGVQVIRRTATGSFIVWGNRTLFEETAWKWKHQRELMSAYELDLLANFDWIAFQLNDEDTRHLAVQALDTYFGEEFRKHALRGKTETEAYSIEIDEGNNTQADADAGNLNASIGLNLVDAVERFHITIGRDGVSEQT